MIRLYACLLYLLLIACSPKPPQWLDYYRNNIPNSESINASLYNYELIVSTMEKYKQEGSCVSVLEKALDYLDIFTEQGLDDKGYVSYYIHYCLDKIGKDPLVDEFLLTLPLSQRKSLYVRLTSVNGKSKSVYYKDEFLENFLKTRKDYSFELRVIEEFYLPILKDTEKSIDEKLKIFEYISVYYPNSRKYYEYIKTEDFKDFLSNLSSKQKIAINKIIDSIKNSQYTTKTKSIATGYIKPNSFAILKTRKHPLLFRTLYRFEGWERVNIYSEAKEYQLEENEVSNDIERLYLEVSYGDFRGFVEKDFIDQDIELPKEEDEWLYEMQKKYFNKQYLEIVEILSKRIKKVKSDFIRQRLYILLYKVHVEIKNRATSIDNNYFKYVEIYPLYYKLSEDKTTLHMSYLFFNHFSSIYKNSPFRFIFLKD